MKVKPIRTHADLQDAKGQLADLITSNQSGANDDDIEVLALLIEQFERTAIVIDAPTPVSAIRFRMEQLGLTPRQLEPFIGSRARVYEVLNGTRSLSLEMIRSLHEGLSIPYESLIRRQDSELGNLEVKPPTLERLNSMGFSLEASDVPAFVQRSLFSAPVPSLHKKTLTRRAVSKTDHAALVLWQSAVLKMASEIGQRRAFDIHAIDHQYVRNLARLSTRPEGAVGAIDSLRDLGISVVILPQLPGTYLDGAAMIDGDGRPIIALTLRYDRTDGFWFTLMHEIAHIRLHYDKLRKDTSAFVDDLEIASDDQNEKEADEFARNALIPEHLLAQVRWGDDTTLTDILGLASRARCHPAIVAGRWQRDHQNYRKFSRLIERDALRPLLKL